MRFVNEDRSIPEMALHSAERFGEDVAVLDGPVHLSFRDISHQMLAVARALVAGGLQPGDRVAVWAPNSAAWIPAALGIHAAGGWLVPLNTRFKGNEAAYVLGKVGARTLICADGFLGVDYVDMLRRTDPSLASLGDTVILDGPGGDGTTGWRAFLDRGAAVDDAAVMARIEAIRPEDVCDVIFTSGTTGHPKGVMLRHQTSMRCYRDYYNEGWQLGPGDRAVVVPPFFHCFGYKAGWLLSLMVGAASVPVAVFDPGATLRLIEELAITHIGGAPSMFWALLDHPDRPARDLSSLRSAIASAAYVPVELVQRMRAELGVANVMSGYGLTEAHALASVSHRGDPADIVADWSGQILRDTEYRLVDDAGQDVPLGDRGELLLRGFNLMSGYFEDPDATSATIDADGWLHTGDIAYASADRYIKVCDRKKDMFIVNGFNVAPAEVEGILVDWDRIAAAAVVGIPDRDLGELGVAFIVPAAGAALTPDEVISYAREHMANFKVPRRVEIVDALPINATGKIVKAELRSRLQGSVTGQPRP